MSNDARLNPTSPSTSTHLWPGYDWRLPATRRHPLVICDCQCRTVRGWTLPFSTVNEPETGIPAPFYDYAVSSRSQSVKPVTFRVSGSPDWLFMKRWIRRHRDSGIGLQRFAKRGKGETSLPDCSALKIAINRGCFTVAGRILVRDASTYWVM